MLLIMLLNPPVLINPHSPVPPTSSSHSTVRAHGCETKLNATEPISKINAVGPFWQGLDTIAHRNKVSYKRKKVICTGWVQESSI